MTPGRLLVVTAVAAERDAVAAGLRAAGLRTSADADDPAARPPAVVIAGGVGPAAAAASTATALARAEAAGDPYGLVVSAGIGGGFAPDAPLGAVAVATSIVAADLGAETPEGFLSVEELGFGTCGHRSPPELVEAVAGALEAVRGQVLTVSTVTGTAERATELSGRHPGAVAEAMEGFGVAQAAAAAGVPVLEIRAVSNAVGPRDRAAWRIGEALAALTTAFGRLPAALAAARPARGTETVPPVLEVEADHG